LVNNVGDGNLGSAGIGFNAGGAPTPVKGALTWLATDTNNRGRFLFCINNVADSSNVAITDYKMEISETGDVFCYGNVGIGTTNATATLDVNGTIKIRGGSPAAGKVLTSDANGLASWSTAPSSSQWTTNGNTIYYGNDGIGQVGIGTSGCYRYNPRSCRVK